MHGTESAISAYVDESIHCDADAIVTSIVFAAKPLDDLIRAALEKNQFVPGLDEFKSSLRMSGNTRVQALRADLREILSTEEFRVGICVDPLSNRSELGVSVVQLIHSVRDRGYLGDNVVLIWFDDGLLTPQMRRLLSGTLDRGLRIADGSNSRKVYGLQLADLCAHTAATMLRSRMGLVRKERAAGTSSGYDPDTRIDLGFELWHGLRRNLASDELVSSSCDDRLAIATLRPFGLRISDNCSPEVAVAAESAFGSVYLGCTH